MSDHTLPQNAEELERAQRRGLERSRPPTEVAGYEFEHSLGAGAYGEVWVAIDRNTAHRVAIKFYAHRGGLDWSLLSREVEKLAFLFADRYVVQLIDVGWDANPPYYVMEYLEGGSLEDRLVDGPLTVQEATALFQDIGIGLVHAHGKGVLHCDLKPANVLLDQDFKPRLADFGQSRLSHEQTPALGTLFYMAPEQADLSAVPDARWDVYALGALFYCMLTGQPPYRSEQGVRDIERTEALEDRLARYRNWIVTSPQPMAHRQVAKGLDSALAEIVDRCLEVNPARRYPNVQAVLNALEERSTSRARRPLLVLGALGPALLLLVMSIVAWSGFNTAIADSDKALAIRAQESNRFAARLVAETVAQKIERRWHILEHAASEPGFRDLLSAATTRPLGHPLRDKLQERVERMHADLHRRYPDLRATSWFVTDDTGTHLARSPLDPNIINLNYGYRDYFHGRGRDLPPGSPQPAPIRDVHRSNVYVSSSTKRPMVAFSVPVWGAASGSERKVLGVMAMTVHLGDFAELPSGEHQMVALVDTLQGGDGKSGWILEHPYFPEPEKQGQSFPQVYIEPEQVARFQSLRKLRLKEQGRPRRLDEGAADNIRAELSLAMNDNYRDPVAGDAAGRWLAAAEPVFIPDRPASVRDTGWVVMVQERYDAATMPVERLAQRLVQRGLIGLAVIAGVVTALWGFVYLLLSRSSKERLFHSVRRRAGLPTPVVGAHSGTPRDSSAIGTIAESYASDVVSKTGPSALPAESGRPQR